MLATQATYLSLYIPLFFFFFNAPPTTEIYTLSLHDALPIPGLAAGGTSMTTWFERCVSGAPPGGVPVTTDRKSTRLNSSHQIISYAVFCLKKKKQQN